MKQIPEYLSKFLDHISTDPRKGLTKPFIQNGELNMTDGRVLIAMPGEDWEFQPSEVDAPVVGPIIGDAFKAKRTFIPLDADATNADFMKPCSTCCGSGRLKRCTDCAGDGLVTCGECGHEHDCDGCRGKGHIGPAPRGYAKPNVECGDCSGTGTQVDRDKFIMFGKSKLTIAYTIRWMLDLPGVRIAKMPTSNMPVPFTFDGGRGIAMPSVD